MTLSVFKSSVASMGSFKQRDVARLVLLISFVLTTVGALENGHEQQSDFHSNGAVHHTDATSHDDASNNRELQRFDGECFLSGTELKSAVDSYLMNDAPDSPVAHKYGWPMDNWCVGEVRDFSDTFSGARSVRVQTFNLEINSWNTSSAITMENMFHQSFIFNKPLSNWNVQNVVNMEGMFHRAASFNGEIASWHVARVKTAKNMFREALNFNQDISGWNVSSMEDMEGMFQGTLFFDQDLSSWEVLSVLNLRSMFASALRFSQDLCPWGDLVEEDTDATRMFEGAEACADTSDPDNFGTIRPGNFCQVCFGCAIDRTDLRAAVAAYLEDNSNDTIVAATLGHPIGTWCVDYVTEFDDIFNGDFNDGAMIFNEDISTWNVSQATSMFAMFRSAMRFNQDLTGWDVSKVTMMREMFVDAISFNGDISNWDVSKVENTKDMFLGAIAFNQDISGFDVSNVKTMVSMFEGAFDFNQDINVWNVSGVVLMDRMFEETLSFDQPLDMWDVSGVTSMRYMFRKSGISQDISGWDVGNVKSMGGMFENARSFAIDLTPWDVSNVEDFSDMFRLAKGFNIDMCGWNTKVSRSARFLGMFGQSGCLVKLNPAFGIFRKGPFCRLCLN